MKVGWLHFGCSWLVCGLLVLAAAGCTKVTTSTGVLSTGNRATIHGLVRVAIIAEPNTLNPVTSFLIQEAYMEGAIFNGLVKLDNHGNWVPDLATTVPTVANGGISPDGKTMTYHLRRGVTWQDGAPFTSADVAFTYRTYINPKVNTGYTAIYQHIASVEAPDPFTVVLHLKAPFAPANDYFFVMGNGGFVIPKHLLEKSPDINTDPFGKHPIGTGPFRLERWDHGSLIVLKPYQRYFGGVPKLREIDVHIIVNPNTQLEMVTSHEIDVAAQLVPVQYAQIQGMSGVRAVLAPTLLERFLTFNLRREPFRDARVRRALALALNRDRIGATAYSGTSVLAQSLIPPSSWAYDPSGAPAYDVAQAKALLDQAGWRVGPDGIRVKNGRRLSFGLLNQTEITSLSSMAQEIQRAWHDIGVDADIQAVPRNVIYSNPSGLAFSGRFDALIDDYAFIPDPDLSLNIETHSFAPHGFNLAFYSDRDVDSWSEQGLTTMDAGKRKRLYSLIQRRLNRDLPHVPLVWEGRIYAINSDLRGFLPEPVNTDFWNAEQWQI